MICGRTLRHSVFGELRLAAEAKGVTVDLRVVRPIEKQLLNLTVCWLFRHANIQ